MSTGSILWMGAGILVGAAFKYNHLQASLINVSVLLIKDLSEICIGVFWLSEVPF